MKRNVLIINYLAPKFLHLIISLSLCFYCLPTTKAQPLDFLPDSVKQLFAQLPETMYDSIYDDIGSKYYAQYTPEGYNHALDCFNKGLFYAEKYKHTTWIAEESHSIGSIYDAQADAPDKVLMYYKRAYDMSKTVKENEEFMYLLAYDVAHAYNLLRDSANSMAYLKLVEEGIKFSKNNPTLINKNILLRAYLSMKNNDIKGFLTLYESLDTTIVFKNGRFPFGRYFAICTWRYAFEKGEYDKAINALQFELINSPTDSSIIMSYLSKAYAGTKNYEKAYYWADALNRYDDIASKEKSRKSLIVNLLQTDNLLKEREKKTRERENTWLLIGFVTTLLLSSVALFYWRSNYKSNKILAVRNAEKDVLINEIHHRVKNNLQLLYGLAKLQLPTIKDENARILWKKNLSQLQAMSLVNEKLYANEGVASLHIKTFITDILTHFEQIYPMAHPLSINVKIDENLVVNAQFAVSFGLILAELMTNSHKYAFNKTDNPRLSIAVFEEKNNHLLFSYSDFNTLTDPSVLETKQVGGTALIRDLTRQLKGKLIINNDPYLIHQFDFELNN